LKIIDEGNLDNALFSILIWRTIVLLFKLPEKIGLVVESGSVKNFCYVEIGGF
jgi:hypothetical protein